MLLKVLLKTHPLAPIRNAAIVARYKLPLLVISDRMSKACCHCLLFSQALTVALNTHNIRLLLLVYLTASRACCPCLPFLQAKVAALKLIT